MPGYKRAELVAEFTVVPDVFALKGRDSLADHPQVQVEPYAGNVPGLLTAEQVSCATEFKIFQRHLHPRAQLIIGRNGVESFVRVLRKWLVWVIQECLPEELMREV